MIHVLYAEDDPVVATLMGSCFSRFGANAVLEVVPTGRACLERMAQGGVDVLLLDLELPDINGLRILGELAIRGDATPVIMVSGRGQTELAVKALRAGAVDCVDKGSPQFLQIVDMVTRVHERQQAAGAALPVAVHRPEKYCIWLIEGSVEVGEAIAAFFATSAQQLELIILTAADELERRLKSGLDADGVLIGTPPAGLDPFDVLRKLRSDAGDLPVIMLTGRTDAEAAVAAFKLGAQDYILRTGDYLAQVVFSLSHGLRRAELGRRNAQLSRELAAINRSLEAQVETRTAELHALSLRLLRVQEDERRDIARELHDQIGQMLTGLKLQLEAAALEARPHVRARLDETLELAKELLSRTRALTLQLRPRLLDDLGLQPALEWHLELFQRQTGIAVASEFSLPAARLPGELETTIFRVVQEALTNVARHSGCKEAHVTVVTDEAHILAEITDRGRGFDVEQGRAKSNSLGLAGMAERVTLAGGKIELFSSPGKGTRVHASFPLPDPAPAP
jgi:signal transduction histidine kinase